MLQLKEAAPEHRPMTTECSGTPALSFSQSQWCQKASAISVAGRRCCNLKICRDKKKRDLVVAWTRRFRKGDAECQDQTWSRETKVLGVSHSVPKEPA